MYKHSTADTADRKKIFEKVSNNFSQMKYFQAIQCSRTLSSEVVNISKSNGFLHPTVRVASSIIIKEGPMLISDGTR